MPTEPDVLTLLAPMLRVRPELQDYCRLGAGWRSPHAAEATGWAAFHIVVRGACEVERPGQPPVRLDAGDVLLLPHGDAHVVYGGRGRHALRPISVTDRDYIRVKETRGAAVETELLCGRLHLDPTTEHLLLAALPHVIVLHLASAPALGCCGGLVGAIRDEVERDRAGAAAICRDLASAFFVILLRQYLDDDPPVRGLLALLGQRNTALAAAAMLREPARSWGLDELARTAVMSRAALVRAFRRRAGRAPRAFLTELRLGMARDRVMQTAEPFARIAAAVGYHSEAALSRALSRRFGARPGAMRSAARASTTGAP